jgi:hypothetical protein
MFKMQTQLCRVGRKLQYAAFFLTTVLLTGCGGGGSVVGSSPNTTSTLRIAATPNPNVFPLLVALSQSANLPVTLVPVASFNDAVTALNDGAADALLSMTYSAAQGVANGKVPSLELVSVNFWGGFSMLAPASANITKFSDLVGKGVLVSGPTSGGQGVGPDLIFQAAAKRAGLTAGSFNVCYLSVMQATSMLLQQQNMNTNSACNASFSNPPTAISLVEPAATGLVMDSMATTNSSGKIVKSINYQILFTGYSSWPQTQLPHGGISILSSVLGDSSRKVQIQTVLNAYRFAADTIMAAKGNPSAMSQVSATISGYITTYYGQYGLSLPAQAIAGSLASGDMVFRTDLSISNIHSDLTNFLTEVVGVTPPASFFHPL